MFPENSASMVRIMWRKAFAAATILAFGAGLMTSAVVAEAQPIEEVFGDLTDALLYHEDREVREAAAHALGQIGGEAAYAALEKAGFLDWPMWRYDMVRSANTPLVLNEELHLQWVRELPEPKRAWPHQWDDRGKLDFDVSYTPVVKGDKIFVPSNVTDSVTAYSIDNGAEQWRFYADGPVRLAPTAWQDNVYFVSDDSHLYCVDAETGELVWKFRGGPAAGHLLGNERIISFWAARGGPVIVDGTVYFTAGFWPLHGIFIYALDAETGDIEWVNDRTSSDYVPLPHGGAYGYGGLAPQGYIAADEENLVISGGRSAAGYFERATGDLSRLNPREGSKGFGGYGVHIDGVGIRRNEMLQDRVAALEDKIGGEVFYKLAAHGRLFVTTVDGTLYCFGPEEVEPIRHEYVPESITPKSSDWAETAQALLDELGESGGYTLMLGAGSGDLLRELLVRSDLHIAVVESDSGKVRALRDELAGAGVYGRRAAVIEAEPVGFSVQPYLFSMVLSEDAEAITQGIDADAALMANTLDRLRPYGGVAFLGGTPDAAEFMGDLAVAANVDQVSAEVQSNGLFATRGGPLTGAGEWTHQYRDASNTLSSKDERVRLPLGLLWYGGPNNHNILPRHSGGPRPHIMRGRQIYLGVENIAARCVYTGRQLWDVEFPGIGHPFTNLELEKRWANGDSVYMTNIPGATYIGSPFVTQPDAIYLRYEGDIYKLAPATGETIDTFATPGRSVQEIYDDEDAPDWGHMSVQGDYLITTAEPHIFEDQVIGWTESYTATSSRMLAVMNRHDGSVLWMKDAAIGFRHQAIVSSEDVLYVIDGLSENALERLARRGEQPDAPSKLYALDLASGEEIWSTDSNVYGTFLLYSAEHDILIEGGSVDMRRPLDDEPRGMTARVGSDGELLWETGRFTLPGAVVGDMLIPGRPGIARSILTGEEWMREQPHTGESAAWTYARAYGCNTLNASQNLLLYRTGYAGYFDLEFDSGTGTFSGFRAGCTANMMAADGVLNALDYTRTCTCSYQQQTSLALVHMPGDTNIELWTRYDASAPDPQRYGLNFGAPGRRVDRAKELVWHNEEGTFRRHPSAILENGGSIDWVVASVKEFDNDEEAEIEIYDLLETQYTVRLHFAELNEDVQPAERVFDVLIDGEEVLSGVDIVEMAGGALRGVVEEVSVDANMTMTVALRKTEDSELDPVIAGIELIANEVHLAAVE